MSTKKRKKEPYVPGAALHPVCLRAEVENLARDLHKLACEGSEVVWPELQGKSFKENPELQKKFLTASHEGMNAAQKKIIEFIQSDEPLTDSHHVLFTGIADAMAWQLIRQQLCHARRFYKGHPPVNLKESNFESVVYCAEEMARQEPGSISIISDLTSFVQVGDLLKMDSSGRTTVVEVKEGKKNHEILEFMNFFIETPCSHAFNYFAQQHGESGVKQLRRMFRQAERMEYVTEVMRKGKSVDPDTKQTIHIPEKSVYISNWDEELNDILEDCDAKGWGWNIVDDCLFIGAYSKDTHNGNGHLLFNMLFDEFEGSIGSPRLRLNDCMLSPLALTVFNLNISEEHKFDILFGRKNVCLGLNIVNFLDGLKEAGITVRPATNKEASQIEQQGVKLYRFQGKAIFIGTGAHEVYLSDGMFVRIFFHGQRPIDTVIAILSNLSTEPV
ncbi:hypothetical protein [Janthinobacterium sp. HH01]|uniref:hypothetical protein n=1 Tax=Janthinobacterium sp. HH01 TaxID=1198452 RepID=UPI0003497F9E|nr:hypothetical protein [Janthinobacterium sp. HH01]